MERKTPWHLIAKKNFHNPYHCVSRNESWSSWTLPWCVTLRDLIKLRNETFMFHRNYERHSSNIFFNFITEHLFNWINVITNNNLTNIKNQYLFNRTTLIPPWVFRWIFILWSLTEADSTIFPQRYKNATANYHEARKLHPEIARYWCVNLDIYASLFRRRDVSRNYWVQSRAGVSFTQSSQLYSTGAIVCREFTQSRLQLLDFAFINENVYRTIYRSRLGSRCVTFQEKDCRCRR